MRTVLLSLCLALTATYRVAAADKEGNEKKEKEKPTPPAKKPEPDAKADAKQPAPKEKKETSEGKGKEEREKGDQGSLPNPNNHRFWKEMCSKDCSAGGRSAMVKCYSMGEFGQYVRDSYAKCKCSADMSCYEKIEIEKDKPSKDKDKDKPSKEKVSKEVMNCLEDNKAILKGCLAGRKEKE